MGVPARQGGCSAHRFWPPMVNDTGSLLGACLGVPALRNCWNSTLGIWSARRKWFCSCRTGRRRPSHSTPITTPPILYRPRSGLSSTLSANSRPDIESVADGAALFSRDFHVCSGFCGPSSARPEPAYAYGRAPFLVANHNMNELVDENTIAVLAIAGKVTRWRVALAGCERSANEKANRGRRIWCPRIAKFDGDRKYFDQLRSTWSGSPRTSS